MALRDPAFADAALVKRVRASATFAAVLLAVLFALAQRTAHGADDPQCATPVARVASAQGAVEVRRSGSGPWEAVKIDDALCAGDMVRVGRNSRAAIALINDISLRLDQRTTLTLAAPDEKRGSLLDLCKGALHFITRYPKTFRVITPFVNAAVEGTEFYIGHGEAEDSLTVFEGRVVVTSEMARLTPQSCDAPAAPAAPGGSLTLAGGESAVVAAGQAPQKRLMARPQDAVQWALYYPPIIDSPPAEGGGAAEWQTRWNESRRLLQAGDAAQALSSIADISPEAGDAGFLVYRAGLFLHVGRVDEANRDIERALQLGRRDSDANALKAIVRVSRNEKDQALALATQAVEQDPKSAAARIALSYARQTQFDLDDALHSARDAAELEPQNAIAWARIAELEMSIGNLDAALAAAKTAAEANPRLARTHVILGFANLTRFDTAAAKTAFDEAIRLDSADPLPRLGLGLAKIKQGALREGRAEIEIAVSLDPGNSLMRSYMGKAYYEEKRDALAGTQFDLAKQRDPKDPTPWFYDAIRKQAESRPVDALRDLQRSIDLNDNRAVFRSRLLLDEDLAARSAGLARMYQGLGFDRLALQTAFEAADLNPESYSAHRMIADTYLAKPRHEIARVSELLRAQLLQPLGLSPIQPEFAESDLVMLDQSGVTTPSSGDFASLFVRDRFSLLAGAVVGSRDTLGSDLVVSGVSGPVSFSAGGNHLETDGSRRNDDLNQDAYGLLVQARPAANVGLQAEFRRTHAIQGDRRLNFDPNSFRDTLRERRQSDFARLGVSYKPTPESRILGSFSYRDFEFRSTERTLLTPPFPPFVPLSLDVEIDSRQKGHLAEIQHLWRGAKSSLTSGAGWYDASDDAASVTTARLPPRSIVIPGLPPILLPAATTTTRAQTPGRIRHANAYSYGIVNVSRPLQLILGLSADAFRQTRLDLDLTRISPKLGVVWQAVPGTTVRLAAFRALKRPLTANQTIEPTHVAGFNQFFDDINGTLSRRYGIGVDQRLAKRLYGGIELSKRDLRVPALGLENRPWKERSAAAYLYWHTDSLLAARAGLDYLKIDRRGDARFNDLTKLQTTMAPFGINFFLPGRTTLRLDATHVRQKGEFATTEGGPSGSDHFWLIDTSLDILLPRGFGSVGIAATNLLDRSFRLQQDIDPTKPTLRQFEPLRRVFFRVSLSL